MMPKNLNSEEGFAGAMLVVAIAVVIGVIIVGVVSKMGTLNKSYDKARAFYDSENAIESFGVSLKNAYDKANYLQDTPPQSGGTSVKDDYGCPGKVITIGSGSKAVRLCWEYAKGICSKRSLNAGLDICLEAGSLQVNLQSPDEWMVAYSPKTKSFEQQLETFKEATRQVVQEMSFQPAHAALDAFAPALPATPSANSIPINMAMRNRPEAPDCDLAQYQCLKVSFCVKNGSSCSNAELIRQTYIFSRPATTTQGY
ncbi:hypothetical protein [Bdellovibrio sp. KM01]|uniref:hypothetical protein n=1 Tax=Bdellovibrio sp. KM01 TaxID=2748865 RepID=UPI0015EAF54F|nr:hypothetical protein [Bdellovibrio sp. KM01]QLY25564.1 hypothetical protein HW988_00435 [Bdellovibrio sp. KM01]